MVSQVNLFEYLRDVEYFVKQTEIMEKKRAEEI